MSGANNRSRHGLTVALFITVGALVLNTGLPAAAAAQNESANPGRTATSGWIEAPQSLLLTNEEIRLAETLDIEQREEFLRWFWGRRDPRPETVRNEFRDDFRARVAEVNQLFGDYGTRRRGWVTARGLCYLILGPPDSRVYGSVNLPERGGMHDGEVWHYTGTGRGATLRIVFARVDGRDVIVSRPQQRGMSGLRQALDSAKERSVHDHVRPFGRQRPKELDRAPLPVRSNVAFGEDADDIELSLSAGDLYGVPVDAGLAVHLDIRLLGDVPVAPAPGDRSDIDTMHMRLVLRTDEARSWASRPVRVLVRLPHDDDARRRIDALEVIETTTGRRARISLRRPASMVPTAAPMPAGYPVDKLLAVSKGHPGGSVAIAFVAATASDASATNTLWLSRTGALPPGEARSLPGNDLRLVHVGQGRH